MPPFALSRAKEYGNKPEDEYIDWFRDFAAVMWDKLTDDGSLSAVAEEAGRAEADAHPSAEQVELGGLAVAAVRGDGDRVQAGHSVAVVAVTADVGVADGAEALRGTRRVAARRRREPRAVAEPAGQRLDPKDYPDPTAAAAMCAPTMRPTAVAVAPCATA